ncbi:DUF2252 domain-containing protein [Derxia gummosa]|uniref:DUF2252 domain-containing protein n=1 Tax=Derxia gummosa DSM 723 TaxID=1121388 RepID=A0A8B6XC52_9BURK|nr:DUF2252 family protein [Derxia gummosa]
MDIARAVLDHNRHRDPERLALKLRKMRGDAFVFLRGTAHLFHARVPLEGLFTSAPPVWACGDLHLENFGSYKADDRQAQFDINDFDEAALAPASWDLLRLLTSLRVGSAGLGIKAKAADDLCGALLGAYAAALAAGKAGWIDRDTADGQIGRLLADLRERKRADYIGKRTEAGRKGALRLRTDTGKALPASEAQRAAVRRFMAGYAANQPAPRFFDLIDVARRVAGTGSLGIERYVLLVRGKGEAVEQHYLLDLKQALPSSLAERLAARGGPALAQPAWPDEAARVVGVMRRMQAASMAFLEAVDFEGRPFVLRGLQPAEDRVTLDRKAQTADELRATLVTLGRLLAWAQLRSGGRQGSACADTLIAWGEDASWHDGMLDASALLAEQVREDSAAYDAACKDGRMPLDAEGVAAHYASSPASASGSAASSRASSKSSS